MMNVGCRLFGLTTEEALHARQRQGPRRAGLTWHARGRPAGRLGIWDVESPGELAYRIADLVNPRLRTR
jgi:hypothetical protein